uniref:Uncharacterized protein n=1 Tax=Panagrolaimus sp. JU765 TaxID=591449 RepID=A0AC34RKS3_9BILA
GIKGYPEVDVSPGLESDEDLQHIQEGDLNDNDNLFNSSGNSLLRSETRQNRNLATGSASLSGGAIDRAESLDDFEEEERKIQQELETSGDNTNLGVSLQNRQENYSSNAQRPADDEDYDSDYPDVEYPKEPPPAYSSPPKSPIKSEQNMDDENIFYHDHPDEDDYDEED